MNKLIVIDMQHDFVDGSLANAAAQKIVPDMVKYIQSFDGSIIFTQDTHSENYLSTSEGKKLPITHYLYKSYGWEILPELLDAAKNKETIFINKPTFGFTKWEDYISNGDNITLIGTCTGICVISNALILKAMFPDSEIHIKSKLCAGLTEDLHKEALDIMKSCQCDVE